MSHKFLFGAAPAVKSAVSVAVAEASESALARGQEKSVMSSSGVDATAATVD